MIAKPDDKIAVPSWPTHIHVLHISCISLLKNNVYALLFFLTHWGRVTHICIVELTIIGSDNGLSPWRRQAIIWTNAGILLIGPLGTNFIEILIGIQTFSFKEMHLKMSSAKWRPFCLGLNVLKCFYAVMYQPILPIFFRITYWYWGSHVWRWRIWVNKPCVYINSCLYNEITSHPPNTVKCRYNAVFESKKSIAL